MPGRSDRRRRFKGLPLLMAGVLVTIASLSAFSLFFAEHPLALAVSVINIALAGLVLWSAWRVRREWLQTRVREQWMATTLRSIADGVIATDNAGRIMLMNSAAQQLTGWKEEDALEKPLIKVFQTLDRATRQPAENPIDSVVRAGRSTATQPVLLVARDGAEHVVLSTAAPIRRQDAVTGVVFVFRDVTEHELAESALRASQEIFRLITEHISDYVALLDLDGRRLYASQSYERILGPAAEQYLKSSFAELHTEDRPRIEQVFHETVRTGIGQRTEFRMIGHDGRVFALESVGSPIRDAAGRVDKVLVVSRDISERRRAEEQVRREKEFSDSLINLMPGAFYIRAVDGPILRWNKNLETVTGYSPEELARLPTFGCFPPEDQPMLEERMKKCLAEGYADVETALVTKEGRRVPYYVTGMRVDIDGRPCLLGMGIDITARRAAEQALRATTARLQRQYAALAEQTHRSEILRADRETALHAITELAAQTLDVARVSVWFYNDERTTIRCADLYEAGRLHHSAGGELQAAEYPAYFQALAQERAIAADDAITDPRTCEFAPRYLPSCGITSMLDAPILSGGRMVGVVCHEHTGPRRTWQPDEQSFAGSMADLVSLSLEVAQRRQAEAALREAHDSLEIKVTERTRDLAAANERLKELDRLKSQFLATMSHELRTPLNSIIGFTGILRQGLAGPLNDEQAKQLGMVHSSARHLLGLINDLLDLSRIESGKMDVFIEEFSVADLVEEVIQILTPMAAQKKLRLESQLGQPDLRIRSDRKKCFQVLLNLANNAVKFTELGEVRVTVQTSPETVTLIVTDTGIGIKPENMGHLFDAFRQVDGSARRVYEGTGLGLYLSKHLANLLGGHLTAESEFGIGSRFSFIVPRDVSQKAGPA